MRIQLIGRGKRGKLDQPARQAPEERVRRGAETEATMSEFGDLEKDAEQYAKDHPQQVQEGEQDVEHAVEERFGFGGGQDQGGQGDGSDQGTGQQDPSGQSGQ